MRSSSAAIDDSALAELPAAYVRWHTSRLGRITDALEEQLLLELVGPLTGLDALDVGCDDARFAMSLIDAGARVTAVDPDPRMLTAAQFRFEKAGTKAGLVRSKAEKLPFANNSFDDVVAMTVLCFLREPEIAFAEMARVLMPSGGLVVGDLSRYSTWAVWRRFSGSLDHPAWQAARFRAANDLVRLARQAELVPANIQAAIFYPPFGLAAVLFSGLDRCLSRQLVFGGAFLQLVAKKPAN